MTRIGDGKLDLPNREQMAFGLIGIGVGVFFTFCAVVILLYPWGDASRGEDFSLSRMVVTSFNYPDSEQTQVIIGCLATFDGRSGGQNSRLAAQRWREILTSAGLFNDGGDPNYVPPRFDETIASMPRLSRVLNQVQSELRENYGCEYALSGFPMDLP